jgi:8-oxo-dGTP diphosphatase
MVVGRFLGGIAAVIRAPGLGQYLLLRRASDKDFAPGVWEPVTGRLDQGEGFEEALRREVREEISAEVTVELILGTTHFYRGTPSPDTELVGVVYLCALEDPHSVRIGPEHSEYRWVTPHEAEALLTAPDASTQWCRQVLARAEAVCRRRSRKCHMGPGL